MKMCSWCMHTKNSQSDLHIDSHCFICSSKRNHLVLSTSLHLSNRIFCQMLVRCLTCCLPPRVVDEQNYPPLHKVTAFGWWWVLIPHPASVCPRFMNCRASFSSTCAGKSQADLMWRGQNLPKLKCREWNQNIKHSNEPLRCSELTRMLRKFCPRHALSNNPSLKLRKPKVWQTIFDLS